MPAEADEVPVEQPPPGGWWRWPLAAGLVLVASVVYVGTFDFVHLGDGVVGVNSESLRIASAQASPQEPGTAYVLREPEGSLTVGIPLANRGLLPVTVADIQPVQNGPALEAACHWRRLAVRSTREGFLPRGSEAQLFLDGGFPQGACSPPDRAAESTVDHVVVTYKVLGLVPRRAELSLAVAVTTVFTDDHPRLQGS